MSDVMATQFQAAPAGAEDGSRGSKSVTIAKPAELGLADWMSKLRDWFDKHGVEPVVFKCNGGKSGSQSYEVSFAERHQADLFAGEFCRQHFH